MNVVYDEKEKRGFKLNAVSLAFTVAGVAGILTAIGLVVAAPVILSTIGLQSSTDLLIRYGRWPLLALLLLLGLAVLYRYAPSRRSPKWRWISVGSVVATITWMIGSALLSFYLANFGRLARSSDSTDDLDVDVYHRRLVRRRTQFGNRASDSRR